MYLMYMKYVFEYCWTVIGQEFVYHMRTFMLFLCRCALFLLQNHMNTQIHPSRDERFLIWKVVGTWSIEVSPRVFGIQSQAGWTADV